MEIIGHIVGVIAVITFFVSYQFADKKKIVLIQAFGTGLNCLHYILIGAVSGFAINIVGIFRNLFFYNADKKGKMPKWLPIVLAVAMCLISICFWDGWHSLFIILGLVLNTLFMGFGSAQTLRKSIIFTCSMIIIYNLFEGSYTGVVTESISIVSAIIGLVRYRKNAGREAKE